MRSTLSHIGKYELRSALARTATSIVYDGWDSDIARRVAIKAVPLSALEDSDTREALARFKRGVQAAGQLTHPNVINIYDYGETDDYAYIVMEFVDGPTLKQILDAGERFDIRTICKTMGGILEGLNYSHDYGVVHRDMKPANIMFTKDRRVKITDFGIARLEDNNMTQTGMVIGTPAYMSPEQFMGEKIDWRSDIYSTGVVLYHMITGTRPYDGNLATIMNKVLNSPVPRPSSVSPMATPALDQIVTRAMAKRREQRFQSAAEFNSALQAVLARPEPAPRPVMSPRIERAMPRRSGPGPKFRPSPAVVASAVMVLAATAFGATWYWRSASAPPLQTLAASDRADTTHLDVPPPAPDKVAQNPPVTPETPSDQTASAPNSNGEPAAALAAAPTTAPTGSAAPISPEPQDDTERDLKADIAAATPIPPRPSEFPPPASRDLPIYLNPSASLRRPDISFRKSPVEFVEKPTPPASYSASRRGPGTNFGDTGNGKLKVDALGRAPPELPPLEEALNRLNGGIPETPRGGGPAEAAPEHPLQIPPAYPTVSTSGVGLVCETVTTDTAHKLGLDPPRGLWCTGVTAGSAAAMAGIRSNDVLLKVNGSELHDLARLKTIAANTAAGHTVPVEIFRDGNTRTVQLAVDQLRH